MWVERGGVPGETHRRALPGVQPRSGCEAAPASSPLLPACGGAVTEGEGSGAARFLCAGVPKRHRCGGRQRRPSPLSARRPGAPDQGAVTRQLSAQLPGRSPASSSPCGFRATPLPALPLSLLSVSPVCLALPSPAESLSQGHLSLDPGLI